jgi:hypothetical protein
MIRENRSCYGLCAIFLEHTVAQISSPTKKLFEILFSSGFQLFETMKPFDFIKK